MRIEEPRHGKLVAGLGKRLYKTLAAGAPTVRTTGTNA